MNPEIQQQETLLHSHIASYINTHTKVIDTKTRFNMAKSLAHFIVSAVAKFEKGQLEHGGKIQDRDLTLEIANETIDLFWYNEAETWKQL